MLGIGPVKNQAYVFMVKLMKPGEITYRVNPDIAVGDFKIEVWDWATSFSGFTENSGAISNLSNIPKKHSTLSSSVIVSLSQAEMNHDIVVVTAVDADGLAANWSNNCWVLYPDRQKAVLENKKAIVMVGNVAHLRVYAADGTTVLMDKILKDISGNDITALGAGALAIENAAA